MKEKFLLIVLVVLFVGSCNIEKRRYLPGYNVQKKTNITEVKKINYKDNDQPSSTANYSIHKIENVVVNKEEINSLESKNKIESTINQENKIKKNKTNLSLPQFSNLVLNSLNVIKHALPADSCDIIVMRNGDEIDAKVLEIGLNDVKYKQCDNLNGPTKVIEKNSVFMIKYPNGTKDVFSSEEASVKKESAPEQAKNETDDNGTGFALALLGLVCLIISVFITWYVSILFGGILGLLGALFLIIGLL